MNAKILSFAVLGLSVFFTTLPAQASTTTQTSTNADTYLRVINNWFEPVQVKEGWIAKKTEILNAGRTLDWKMFSGSISDLLISYYRDGWRPIVGCPYGSYSYGLTVHISAAPWDPNTPICQQY